MGITGLLPFLKKATRQCHVSEFRNGTVAIDSYCFLHKGANACAEQLARGEDNQMYVNYCMKYVKMLLSYDIHPIMVFDGRNLPAKAETEAKRRESRKKSKQKAAELLRLGKTEEARTYLKQCIDITPKMANNLIKECQKVNVDCIVSPYESDAQMAFFSLRGIAECVITEDSDLVLFGCQKVLYKLDLQGCGRLVESEKICNAMKMTPDQFTFDKFRFMCILSGCDYVDSLSGIGLKKAEKFLKMTAETNPEIFIDRIPRYLNMKHLVITSEYKRKVLIANATFLHQTVFDPFEKKLVHLVNPELTGTNPEYLINCGDKFDNEKAYQVALGNLNPYNFEVFNDWKPSNVSPFSIWSDVPRKRTSRKQRNKIQKSETGTTSTTSFTLKPQDDDLEEAQIKKDLAIYTNKADDEIKSTPPKVEQDYVKMKTSPEISTKTSFNPFLRKKRLSKFPKTYTCGNIVVKSRFFGSQSSDEQVSEKYESVHLENKDTENRNSDDDIKEIVNICDNSETSKKRILTDSFEEHEEMSTLQVNNEVKLDDKMDQTVSRDTKIRRLGSCRNVGLTKSNSGQRTLHSFFNKLKEK